MNAKTTYNERSWAIDLESISFHFSPLPPLTRGAFLLPADLRGDSVILKKFPYGNFSLDQLVPIWELVSARRGRRRNKPTGESSQMPELGSAD